MDTKGPQVGDIVTLARFKTERHQQIYSDWRFNPRGQFGYQFGGMNPKVKIKTTYRNTAKVIEVPSEKNDFVYLIEWKNEATLERVTREDMQRDYIYLQ